MDSQKGDDLMDSLEHGAAAAAQIPRFDNGMVNIQELLRAMVEALVNEIMDAQAEGACADGNRRNGYCVLSMASFGIPHQLFSAVTT